MCDINGEISKMLFSQHPEHLQVLQIRYHYLTYTFPGILNFESEKNQAILQRNLQPQNRNILTLMCAGGFFVCLLFRVTVMQNKRPLNYNSALNKYCWCFVCLAYLFSMSDTLTLYFNTSFMK